MHGNLWPKPEPKKDIDTERGPLQTCGEVMVAGAQCSGCFTNSSSQQEDHGLPDQDAASAAHQPLPVRTLQATVERADFAAMGTKVALRVGPMPSLLQGIAALGGGFSRSQQVHVMFTTNASLATRSQLISARWRWFEASVHSPVLTACCKLA